MSSLTLFIYLSCRFLLLYFLFFCFLFFFKQKTAYEMRISDWSSDVCSSDLAFALCRPPGHHAGRDYMGGYCYLNNAAIAAREAHSRGLGPVAILDIDYHHGNGTQDIFYADPGVFFASIHADPRTDYPFYWGHADERGAGAGEGATHNPPLRSEERRVGNECVSTCIYRGSPQP